MSLKAVAFAGVGAFIVSTFPCYPQSAPSRRQQIESHARKAQEYLKANRPDLAEGEFSSILTLDSNNIDARANLGVLLFFQGDYAKAAPQLRGALTLRPALWKIQALLGMSEKRIGQIAAARADLEKSFPRLQEEKLRIEAGMELIEIYYGAGDLDKAAGVADVLRQLKPTDIGILYTAHRIYSALADETMLSVAMIAPQSARMRQMMAQEMARQGNTAGAVAQYREALKIDPRIPALHFELAEALSRSSTPSEREEAEKEYKLALADNPFDEKSECRLGEIALGQSDLKGAFAYYSRALELRPTDGDANLGLAKTLMAMGQPREAETHLVRAAQLDPFDSVVHFRLSLLYRHSGRTADADRELAEFRKVKEMKDRLAEEYHAMRLEPANQERPDRDAPK